MLMHVSVGSKSDSWNGTGLLVGREEAVGREQ